MGQHDLGKGWNIKPGACDQSPGVQPVPSDELVEQLRSYTAGLLCPLIGTPRRVCIIDPPDHPNVGDSAILLGEINFLRRNFPNAELVSVDSGSYAERLIERADLLLFHGGGNFGDLYPNHHHLRLQTLERFPNIRAIQFPQSIYFREGGSFDRTVRAIEKHRNFHFLARDKKSLAYATTHFPCDVSLCPDMAFSMNAIRREKSVADYVCLLRTDDERAADHEMIFRLLSKSTKSVIAADWIEPERSRIFEIERSLRGRSRVAINVIALRLRQRYAWERLRFGIRTLSKGRRVITDRLHGHIISCLLGIEHFVFDSLDGKVSSFYDSWTRADKGAHLITSADEFETALSVAAHPL